MVRNAIIALTFIAAGYILQRHNVTDKDVALHHYQYFFLMIITLSVIGIIFGVVMNVMDIRKESALNARICKWQQSNIETIGLISMEEPANTYYGNNDANESDECSMDGM
ncbi:uncharacterized protein LOC117327395 [Pecten maximus]|uniref:uncharacterized protein LOC117327395 n=1 Tax=Pecten maximus TaxID=6579 RepID=UPI001457EAA6|nr:uncharacterized protein LOC117327395 [Pecten maximus]